METVKLILKGRVQGVGMRYSIHQKAKDIGLFGYVKNLSNGAVEVLLQGEKHKLENMMTYLNNDAPGSIDSIEEREANQTETHKDFKVTF